MMNPPRVPGLSVDGCRTRQNRLRRLLDEQGLDAALLCDRRYVHYFTGYWHRPLFSPVAWIPLEGPALLSSPLPVVDPVAADEVVVYESNRRGSLVAGQLAASVDALGNRLAGRLRIGCDGTLPACLLPGERFVDLGNMLLPMRCQKDPDELAMLRFAIAACEKAYEYAAEALEPGRTEVELFAGMQAAAAEYVGEVVGEFGNDFQIGATGSLPRHRPAQAGEMAVFDLSVVVRGYASDMCRSFVVGREPSDKQQRALGRVAEVLGLVQQKARAGTRCAALYEEAHAMLEGFCGWSFPHHLGHGIGLNHHESPYLNPGWDDTFRTGNVFTAEPGLYGDDLRAGLRIEEIYHVTPTGLEKLTTFPAAIA